MRVHGLSLALTLSVCLSASPLVAQSPADILSEAHEHETAQQYDKAATAYQQYLSEHPENDEIRAALARVLSWQGSYEEAVTLYEDILTRHPRDMEVRVALARVRSWQKKYTEAEAGYRSVLREDSDNVEAKRGLADTLYWSGHYAEALRWYEDLSAIAADPELTQRIAAVKTELASLTRAQALRAPVGLTRALPTLPFRDYVKVGYSHFTYTDSLPDERNGLVEASKSIGTRTLVGRVEPLNRFGSHDTPVSGEFYSSLWPKAWGYLGALATVNPSFAPHWSLGGEVFQGLGDLHAGMSFLEPSFGYRHMVFKSTSINLLIPGVTIYLPYNFWLTEKVFYVPESGATTLFSRLTWRPTGRLQLFVSGAFGTSSNQIRTTQDFMRISSHIIEGGVTFPLSDRLSIETSGYYEDRSQSYIRRGVRINLFVHW